MDQVVGTDRAAPAGEPQVGLLLAGSLLAAGVVQAAGLLDDTQRQTALYIPRQSVPHS